MNKGLIVLGGEMRQGFSEMRQGFVRVDQRLDRLDSEVADLRHDVTELRGEMTELRGDVTEIRQDVTDLRHDVVQLQEGVAQLRQGLAMLGQRVDVLDQRVQSNGVLLEPLRGEVRQIAKAYVLLDQRVERYRNENEMAHREILALLHSSYRELDRRLTVLEERARDAGDDPRP
jgi:chromosome segregation ATPase